MFKKSKDVTVYILFNKPPDSGQFFFIKANEAETLIKEWFPKNVKVEKLDGRGEPGDFNISLLGKIIHSKNDLRHGFLKGAAAERLEYVKKAIGDAIKGIEPEGLEEAIAEAKAAAERELKEEEEKRQAQVKEERRLMQLKEEAAAEEAKRKEAETRAQKKGDAGVKAKAKAKAKTKSKGKAKAKPKTTEEDTKASVETAVAKEENVATKAAEEPKDQVPAVSEDEPKGAEAASSEETHENRALQSFVSAVSASAVSASDDPLTSGKRTSSDVWAVGGSSQNGSESIKDDRAEANEEKSQDAVTQVNDVGITNSNLKKELKLASTGMFFSCCRPANDVDVDADVGVDYAY